MKLKNLRRLLLITLLALLSSPTMGLARGAYRKIPSTYVDFVRNLVRSNSVPHVREITLSSFEGIAWTNPERTVKAIERLLRNLRNNELSIQVSADTLALEVPAEDLDRVVRILSHQRQSAAALLESWNGNNFLTLTALPNTDEIGMASYKLRLVNQQLDLVRAVVEKAKRSLEPFLNEDGTDLHFAKFESESSSVVPTKTQVEEALRALRSAMGDVNSIPERTTGDDRAEAARLKNELNDLTEKLNLLLAQYR